MAEDHNTDKPQWRQPPPNPEGVSPYTVAVQRFRAALARVVELLPQTLRDQIAALKARHPLKWRREPLRPESRARLSDSMKASWRKRKRQ